MKVADDVRSQADSTQCLRQIVGLRDHKPGPRRRSCNIEGAREGRVWRGMLSRKGPATARSIQMKKSGRPSAILIRIEDWGRVTLYSALLGYCVFFCFAYSSSCFTIKTYEHRQVASTSVGATNAHSPSAKSVGTFTELFLRGEQRHIARPAYDVDLQSEAAGYHSMVTKRH